MEPIDIFLKCTDEEELFSYLESAGFALNGLIFVSQEYCIDVIGDLYTIDDVLLDGYHCNIRFLREPTEQELLELEPITIPTPNSPRRIWL